MTARIVAPVSRALAVADKARTIAFYRDVLGFEVRGDALVSGPAQLDVMVAQQVRDSTFQDRPRGAGIYFFMVDDVQALRRDVASRGAAPSDLEKVNWIKMEMFQLRDPDGHTLWFGQSFQQPDTPRDPQGQLREALPIFPMKDVQAGIAYYREKLGFSINYSQHDLGVMYRDECTLLLVPRGTKYAGIAAGEFYTRNADELHAELTRRGANVRGEPVSHPWGLRDFTVVDLDGNELIFAETFE